MAYDLIALEDGVGPCRCSNEARRTYVERVDTLLGIPLVRMFRLRRACATCGWTTYVPVDAITRARLPRTAGVMRRIAITWLLLAGVLVGSFAKYAWSQHVTHERALAPEVADLWVIDTKQWVAHSHDVLVPGVLDYGVIKVLHVSDAEVELAGCATSSDRMKTIEDHCVEFPVDIDSVARDQVPVLVADDAIDHIVRPGALDWFSRIMAALVIGGLLIHGWRTKRFLARHPQLV